MANLRQLRQEAQQMAPQLIAWRRDFHMHPELGFQEVRTAGIVAERLASLGLEVATGIGKTGVVAVIEGDSLPESAPTVMLRFDMDALPIQEESDVPYRSQSPGVMHACGHDGHTAIGMAVAQLLVRHRDALAGRVKLVFQPAEEGLGGALAMVEDGVLENPAPDAAFGMHLWSRLPLNQVIVQSGPLWASGGMFRLAIQGRGGHGAMPHETVDATVAASHIVVAWQTVVSRSVDPTQTAVVSVGSLHSGDVSNVISSHAELTGTIRAFSPEIEALVKERMTTIAENICHAFGAACELSFPFMFPATINSESGAQLMRHVAEQIVGVEQIATITPMMVSEDMSEFLNRAPGCYILVGASDPQQGWHSPHHNPAFDFDERVLPTGAALMAGAAIAYLQQQAGRG